MFVSRTYIRGEADPEEVDRLRAQNPAAARATDRQRTDPNHLEPPAGESRHLLAVRSSRSPCPSSTRPGCGPLGCGHYEKFLRPLVPCRPPSSAYACSIGRMLEPCQASRPVQPNII